MPLRKIWDRSKDKGLAEKELAYIYYMTDYKSPFLAILETPDRHREVCSAVGFQPSWKVDADITSAIEFYDKIQETVSVKFLRSATRALKEMQRYFETFDLTERDNNEKLVNQPKDIMTMLKQCGDVMAQIKKLEDEVKKEQASSNTARGNKSVGMFEKG